MRNRRAGSRFGGGIKDVWVGKGVGTGRAALKLKQGEIPACFFRFKPDEPENEANPARPSHVQLKHARDKPVALRQKFSRAFGVVACTCGGI